MKSYFIWKFKLGSMLSTSVRLTRFATACKVRLTNHHQLDNVVRFGTTFVGAHASKTHGADSRYWEEVPDVIESGCIQQPVPALCQCYHPGRLASGQGKGRTSNPSTYAQKTQSFNFLLNAVAAND
jgi:hypothetical protein